MKSQIDQFKRELNLSSNAKKYLEERFFNSNLISQFDLGFCPPTSGYSFDLLNGRIVVPIYDAYGNYVGFAGRKIDSYGPKVREFYEYKTTRLDSMNRFLKWKTAKWINTPYKKSDHLYNLNLAKKYIYESNFCFIVEGYFDVMRLCDLGHHNVVALCGTTLSHKHCELLSRYCTKTVFMLDGDESGRAATEKYVLRARNNNLFASIVNLPNSFDPDNLCKEDLELIKDKIINTSEEQYIDLWI
jgi:DNA primase